MVSIPRVRRQNYHLEILISAEACQSRSRHYSRIIRSSGDPCKIVRIPFYFWLVGDGARPGSLYDSWNTYFNISWRLFRHAYWVSAQPKGFTLFILKPFPTPLPYAEINSLTHRLDCFLAFLFLIFLPGRCVFRDGLNGARHCVDCEPAFYILLHWIYYRALKAVLHDFIVTCKNLDIKILFIKYVLRKRNSFILFWNNL